MITLIVYLIICLCIALIFGNSREIGIGWSFFFCLTFSTIVGLIIIFKSEKSANKLHNYTPNEKASSKLMSLIWLIVGVACLVRAFFIISYSIYDIESILFALSIGIGFLGSSIYFYPFTNNKHIIYKWNYCKLTSELELEFCTICGNEVIEKGTTFECYHCGFVQDNDFEYCLSCKKVDIGYIVESK